MAAAAISSATDEGDFLAPRGSSRSTGGIFGGNVNMNLLIELCPECPFILPIGEVRQLQLGRILVRKLLNFNRTVIRKIGPTNSMLGQCNELALRLRGAGRAH